jgi:hypothetical protein
MQPAHPTQCDMTPTDHFPDIRFLQKQLCTCNNACRSICGAFERIEQIRPHYIGHLWGDYILHALWALGLYFWLPIILSFMCLNLFELFRRAKTIEVRIFLNMLQVVAAI